MSSDRTVAIVVLVSGLAALTATVAAALAMGVAPDALTQAGRVMVLAGGAGLLLVGAVGTVASLAEIPAARRRRHRRDDLW